MTHHFNWRGADANFQTVVSPRPSSYLSVPLEVEFHRCAAFLLPTLKTSSDIVLSLLAGVVVVAFGLFLIGLTGVVFIKPALAKRFFMSFASSARAHYTEQVFRLLIGTSLVVLSPAMWQSDAFQIIGWVIVVTSIGLILIPWRWHYRFAEWALPMVVRHMRLYAVGLFAFGTFLLYGVFYAGLQGAA